MAMRSRSARSLQIKKREFIAALRVHPSISAAAESVGISRRAAYDWKEADPDFCREWEEAANIRTENLESNLLQIAMEGDVTASIFLLKGYKPDVFRERQDVNMRAELSGRVTVVKLREKEP